MRGELELKGDILRYIGLGLGKTKIFWLSNVSGSRFREIVDGLVNDELVDVDGFKLRLTNIGKGFVAHYEELCRILDSGGFFVDSKSSS